MKATRPGPLAMTRWLLDLAIVGLVAVVLFAVVLGRLVPLVGGQTLIIGGPSMEPTLPLGSAVIIRPVDPTAIAVGDIVSVQSGGGSSIFTHRVIRRLSLDGQPYIETKGDNNPVPDGATVPSVAVLGRVAIVVPLMGYVIAWLSVSSGVGFVLGLGALLILAAVLVDSIDADRRTRSRSDALARRDPVAVIVPAEAMLAIGPGSVAALVRRRSRRPELGTEPSGAAPRLRQPRHEGRPRTTRPTA